MEEKKPEGPACPQAVGHPGEAGVPSVPGPVRAKGWVPHPFAWAGAWSGSSGKNLKICGVCGLPHGPEERRGDWCQTVTGRQFWPCDPRPEDVCIEDVSHALSLLCRFGGHTPLFYSVAEHSVRVSRAIGDHGHGTLEEQMWGLFHDAAEAYVGDMLSPLLRSPEMLGYKKVKRGVEDAVMTHFGLPLEMPSIVKHYDLVLLATEKRDLMLRDRSGGATREAREAREKLGAWACDHIDPLSLVIIPWSMNVARAEFEHRFVDLSWKISSRARHHDL